MMLFTVLTDDSLVCNDCLDLERDEDIMVSETSVGACDFCGALGEFGHAGAAGRVAIIALTLEQGVNWAHKQNILPSSAIVLATQSSDSLTKIRGFRLKRKRIVILSCADRGTGFVAICQELNIRTEVEEAAENWARTLTVNTNQAIQQLQAFNRKVGAANVAVTNMANTATYNPTPTL